MNTPSRAPVDRGIPVAGDAAICACLSSSMGKWRTISAPIRSPGIGTTFFRLPSRRVSNGASQYCLARRYFSTKWRKAPAPTLGMPRRLFSHWTKPTGKPWTLKMSWHLSAYVSYRHSMFW